ncbi:MAG: hypothetical protein KDD44_02015 [Bdellovibrionales bacterium]|nr:hypothetical protein [Bdellovibrionales bacterium]
MTNTCTRRSLSKRALLGLILVSVSLLVGASSAFADENTCNDLYFGYRASGCGSTQPPVYGLFQADAENPSCGFINPDCIEAVETHFPSGSPLLGALYFCSTNLLTWEITLTPVQMWYCPKPRPTADADKIDAASTAAKKPAVKVSEAKVATTSATLAPY